MTRYSKSHGKYHISGSNYSMLSGTRAQVWHGTAYKTSGGLKKNNLMKNKSGRIVSKSKHSSAKRENRLVKSGYGTKKGQFGYVKVGTKSKKRGSRGKKGGAYGNSFSPAGVSASGIDGQGVTNYGYGSDNVQFEAGMAGGKKRRSRKRGSRKRGGAYGNSFSPAGVSASGIDGQGVTNYGYGSDNVQFEAGMAGGRSRKRRGGKGYGWLASNGIDGQGVTNYGSNSNNLQFEAGMAGGSRKRRGGKGYGWLNSGNDVQFQAGNAA